MKRCLKTVLLVLSLSLLFGLVFSCNNGLETSANSGMNVNIKASRALAGGLDYDRYVVICEGISGLTGKPTYISLEVKQTTASITNIEGGEWNVTVEAYIGESLEAQGTSGTVIVPQNGSLDVEVELQPLNPTPTATNTATPTATATATTTFAPIEIVNPGAESGTTGWTGDGITSSVEVNSGSAAFLLKHANSLSQTIDVAMLTDYTLTVYAYLNNADTTLSLSAGGSSTSLTAAGSWTEISLDFNSGASTSVTITILSEGKWNWIYVDDFAISGGTPTVTPTGTVIDYPTPTIEPTATFTSTATATNTATPTSTGVVDPSNHVENGTFSDLSGWTLSGTVVVENGKVKLGPDKSSANYFTSKALNVGSMYQFSADAYETIDAGWSGLGFHCLDASGNKLYSRSFEVGSTSMSTFSSYFEVPAGAVNIEVWIFTGGPAGNLYADNVSITLADGVDLRPAPPADGTRVWQETQPGLIVIESESLTADPSQWAELTSDGETYQKYTGTTQTFGGVGLVPLSDITDSSKIMEFKVLIPKSGNYTIKIRNRHLKEDGDNDVWFWTNMSTHSDAQDNWAKFHDHDAYAWTWDESSDWNKPEGFEGGIYTLKYAGRSNGFMIDRIVIFDSFQYDAVADDALLSSAAENYFSYGSSNPTPTSTISITPTPTPTSTIASTPTATATGTPNGIAVDGSLYEWTAPINNSVSKLVSGTGTIDTINYGYLANQAGLYVGVEVLDDIVSTTYSDVDSVEIYIDGDNIAQGNSSVSSWALPGYGADEFQFVIKAGMSGVTVKKPDEFLTLPSGVTGASQLTGNGYEAEIFIPWSVMGISPSSNFTIGFDVGVNDIDTATARERQVMWYGTADNWKNSSLFGDLSLSVSSEVDTEAPSAVSNINAVINDPFFGGVTIEYTAASDNVAVASYTIELSDGQVKTVAGTSCSFSGLAGETNYSVTVTASDAAGNSSVASSSFITPVLEVSASPSPTATWDGNRRPVGGNFAALAPESDVVRHQPFKLNVDWANAYANGDDIWNPDFIAEMQEANYPVIRMMNWGATNGNTIENWSQRAQVTDNHQLKNTYKANDGDTGMAYEWMIDLCNRVDSDLWICVPHKTIDTYEADPSNNYFSKLAQLIKDNLNPHLNVYVEYSNETWNFMYPFTQSYWLGARGVAWNFDGQDYTASFYMAIYGLVRIHKVFDEVFGDQAYRVKTVVGGQGMSKWDSDKDGVVDANWGARVHYLAMRNITLNPDQGMDCSNVNPWDIRPDYYSTATYCGASSGGASDVVQQWSNSVTEQFDVAARVRKSGITLPLVAYEGGSHITTAADQFARHPQVYDMYWEWASRLAEAYELMVHFNHTFYPAANKAWGLLEYTGQPWSQAPRLRAIADYNNGRAKE